MIKSIQLLLIILLAFFVMRPYIAAGPTSLEDFSKRCTFGSKSGTKSLVRQYQAKFAKTVPENLKVCHIWLIKFLKMFSYIFYSHNSIVSVQYSVKLPIAVKKVNIHY